MLLVLVAGLLATANALSDVNQQCIAANPTSAPNEELLGTWYRVYQFILFGSTSSSSSCASIVFDKPTAAELVSYKNKYESADIPYTIDEDSIILDYGYYHGLLSGNTAAKFFVLDPASSMVISGGYQVEVYQKISDDFILYWNCALRGNDRWLLARNRDTPDEELLQIIAADPVMRHMNARKYCA